MKSGAEIRYGGKEGFWKPFLGVVLLLLFFIFGPIAYFQKRTSSTDNAVYTAVGGDHPYMQYERVAGVNCGNLFNGEVGDFEFLNGGNTFHGVDIKTREEIYVPASSCKVVVITRR